MRGPAPELHEKIIPSRSSPALGNPALRVCHLGKFYPPACGGIETHLRTLARAQAQLGAHVRVICVNHRDRVGSDVTWKRFGVTPDVEEREDSVSLLRLGRLGSIARLEVCPNLLDRIRGVARADFDLIHLHVPNPTMLLALALTRPRVPCVITYHSDVVKQRLLARLLRPFEDVVFRRAGAVIVTSPNYPRGSDYLQQHRDKQIVIPFGIELEPLVDPSAAALREAARMRREFGQPLWLLVGRLVYYKGIEQAIRALKQAPGKLAVVGEGPLGGDLRKLASRLGVADRVLWLGRLTETELIGAFHAATALWFPSNARSEAFGLVQVEAMAAGCPVINTNIAGSGVPWVSRHEESGLTVPINDAEALAAAANRLLTESGLRTRLAQNARRRALAEFDQQQMAQRTLELYERVLSSEEKPALAHSGAN